MLRCSCKKQTPPMPCKELCVVATYIAKSFLKDFFASISIQEIWINLLAVTSNDRLIS